MNEIAFTTPAASNPEPRSLDGLGDNIRREVSEQAGRLMRLQAIQSRIEEAKASYAKVLQEVAECHQAYRAETGQA